MIDLTTITQLSQLRAQIGATQQTCGATLDAMASSRWRSPPPSWPTARMSLRRWPANAARLRPKRANRPRSTDLRSCASRAAQAGGGASVPRRRPACGRSFSRLFRAHFWSQNAMLLTPVTARAIDYWSDSPHIGQQMTENGGSAWVRSRRY